MTALTECRPPGFAVRAFEVILPNRTGLVARCIPSAPDNGKRGVAHRVARPPSVDIVLGVGQPIVTDDPDEVRALIAVLDEAAAWLETQEPPVVQPDQVELDFDTGRPVVDVQTAVA